jgi:hypothetical protein
LLVTTQSFGNLAASVIVGAILDPRVADGSAAAARGGDDRRRRGGYSRRPSQSDLIVRRSPAHPQRPQRGS